MQLALKNLHLVNADGSTLVEDAQHVIHRSRLSLGIYKDLAELQVAHPNPDTHAHAYLYEHGVTVRYDAHRWVPNKTVGSVTALDNQIMQIDTELEISCKVFDCTLHVTKGADPQIITHHFVHNGVNTQPIQGLSVGTEFTDIAAQYDAATSTGASQHYINIVGTGSGVTTDIHYVINRFI